MAELSRSEIQLITGLPASSLTRHLARFPLARTSRGRYDTADSDFREWLALFEQGGEPGDDLEAAYERSDSHSGQFKSPSGILMPRAAFEALRGPDESKALAMLDRLIAAWTLGPHPAVPDRLRRKPMQLPSGTVINGSHWRVLRGTNERRAGYAIDVLVRSYGVRA